MRPLRVTESQGDNSTDSSSSGSMQMLDHYLDLESATSRLSLQSADDQSGAEDQENRPPPAARQTRQSSSLGGQAGAAAPAPRRRKQRGPLSRDNRMNREIRRLRACTTPLIPRLPFSRLVRELMMKINTSAVPLRITEGALGALQESSELFLTQRFEDAYLLTHHRGRVTLEVRDMALIAYIVHNCRY
uniref:Cid1 n=1 Tax=Drosophila bicornuta TaxID=112146 RepID=A0A1V0HRJ5_9MUSC|nr:Cid1 [Drosophila bicornuta]